MSRAQDISAQIRGLLNELDVELGSTSAQTVTTADELTAAVSKGGSYRLATGNYVGNFVCNKPVQLLSDGAVLTPKDPLQPTMSIQSNDVSVQKLTMYLGAPDRECVVVGDFNATDAAKQPHRVVLDGCSVRAGTAGGHRGIALHGVDLTVRNCTITGFWRVGQDAQAIWAHNGPGPYLIEDNYCEGSGENILVGGETINISGCVPTDVTIRGNHCFKPDAWRTNGAKVKNCIEIKNGRRVLIENNICDGNWRGGQNGNPIVLTVRNQNNQSPWVIVDDIVVRGNVTKRCTDGPAVGILGLDDNYPSLQSQTMLFEHNLFTDSPYGFSIANGVAKSLTIRNNTMPAIKQAFLILSDSKSDATKPANHALSLKTPLTFVKNVVKSGDYGISGTDSGVGVPALNDYTVIVSFIDNVIEMTAERGIPYPPGNRLIAPGGLAALLDPTTYKMLDGTAGY